MLPKPRDTVTKTTLGIRRLQHLQVCKSTSSIINVEVKQADNCRYLVAKLFQPLIGCDTASLRALNVGALCLICPLSYGILRMLRTRTVSVQGVPKHANANAEKIPDGDTTLILDAHTALNITLFPPLFFFSALYYTDVMSTLVVMLSYSALLKKKTASGSLLENINAISIGAVALLFRQTNIFWVAVFPAGLAVVDALKATVPTAKSSKTLRSGEILRRIWDEGSIHDCSLQDASLQGPNPHVHRHYTTCTDIL
jgi:alpha-1,2-glucosyltransferase